MIKKFLFICVLLCFSTSASAIDLTLSQKIVLKMAYKIGNKYRVKNDTWGETAAAIIFQESHANSNKFKINGIIIGDKNRRGKPKSLGPGQVQLPAARDVEKWFPEIFKKKFGNFSPTEEELIIALLTDIEFNIEVSVAYFVKMVELADSWEKAILAYNRGLNNNGKDPNDYVEKVKKWRSQIVIPLKKRNWK